MDTTRLKRFATEARNILLSGVVQRLTAIGFKPDGTVTEMPQLLGGGAVFMENVQSEDFYHKWMSLYQRMQSHSFREVAEEAAYTWFNRLVAIRIMAKNGLISDVLKYESEDVHVPVLVTEARQGRMPQMDEASRQKLDALLLNDAWTDEQFALLIVAYCHSNPIIRKCFGKISDYTELLLPSNILKNDGFIDRLNADDYVSDEDYRSPELIGWLYQFYIAERKNEVFAKKGKFEADEIPAATQIFTPNWIVKYMVQNTVGRIYLDNNPYSDIKDGMKYLVEPSDLTPNSSHLTLEDVHDLRVADLACGSGHILNECFDLLYQIYIEEGYNRRRAVEDIFQYNLTGIDIDTRAKQLAQFALLLKACQKDRSFADAHCMPRVMDMPQSDRYTWRDTAGHFNCYYNVAANEAINGELDDAFKLMEHADTLGSIIRFNVSPQTADYLHQAVKAYDDSPAHTEQFAPLVDGMRLILALTQKYAALVMNPPYMGSGNMNAELSNYVKKNYPDGKADLATVFVEMMPQHLLPIGRYSFIIPPSWMFLSTFQGLRREIIANQSIDSLLHLSRGVFGADFGASCAVISKTENSQAQGTYFRLVERTFQEFDQNHLRMLFEQTLANHDFKYNFKEYTKDVTSLPYSEDGNRIYYLNVSQKNFEKIPGCPIGYWVSEKMIEAFHDFSSLSNFCDARSGLSSSDNNHFLRLWSEVSFTRIKFGTKNENETKQTIQRWYPIQRGGGFRKWFGLNTDVINWENNGEEIKSYAAHLYKSYTRTIKNIPYYFKPGISWSYITSGVPSFRKFGVGFIIINAGPACYNFNEVSEEYIHAFLNCNLTSLYLKLLQPTFNFDSGPISRLPLCTKENKCITGLVQQNIAISKQDWDAHETSWDFEENELLAVDEQTYIDNINWMVEQHFRETGEHICIDPAAPELGSLEWRVEQYKQKWTRLFLQLHDNEEQLNRQFIDIYGLQDELTPDVPLDEITILQQGEITIDNSQITWHDDVIVKQLISYAVGCMMGRYSLDHKGLILANQGDGQKEYEVLVPNSRFAIDDDGIIPLMSVNNELTDHITLRFKTWLGIAFGEENLMDNLNFVERALDKRLEDYFLKDFWKDHKKMYQNRPIYWLFSSKRGAFQCIVYMHRMNAYTAERVRTKYLLPHIEWLMTKQAEMQANAANLSARERKELDNIGKQIDECREYHDRLHEVADQQIAFDLDDGVLVNYAKFGDVLAKLK